MMSDLIADMYPVALDCGILPEEFWSYSLAEVRDRIESYERTRRREEKQKILYINDLAGLIGMYMQRLFDKDVQIPQPWEQYPALFEAEKAWYEDTHRAEMLEKARTSRKEYAQRYNEMRRRRGLN